MSEGPVSVGKQHSISPHHSAFAAKHRVASNKHCSRFRNRMVSVQAGSRHRCGCLWNGCNKTLHSAVLAEVFGCSFARALPYPFPLTLTLAADCISPRNWFVIHIMQDLKLLKKIHAHTMLVNVLGQAAWMVAVAPGFSMLSNVHKFRTPCADNTSNLN